MKKKYLALMWGGVFSLVASACTSEAASVKSNSKTSEPTQDITKVGVSIQPKKGEYFGPQGPKASDLNVSNVTANFTNPADASKYTLQVENPVYVIDGDQKGEVKFNVKITNKLHQNISFTKTILVNNLRKAFGGFIDLNTQGKFAPDNLVAYNLMDRYHQFQEDNSKYMVQLKQAIASHLQGHLDGQFDRNDFRTDVKTSKKDQAYFDQEAAKLKLNTYEDSLLKGFAVPTYQDHPNANPTVAGLNLYNGEMNKFRSWRDVYNRDEFKANGLPRFLPNEKYKDIALQTYSLSVDNKDTNPKDVAEYGPNTSKRTRGTVWILDYVPRDDGKYPTTWYFGTNLHVADALTNNTTGVVFSILKNSVNIQTVIAPADGVNQQYFDNYYFPNLSVTNEGVAEPASYKGVDAEGKQVIGQAPGIRTVFTADDYLTTDPKNYLVKQANPNDEKNTDYDKYHEFLDFAVIEVDFKALWEKSIASTAHDDDNTHGYHSAEEYAEHFTRDYAKHSDKQIKFLTKSYLTDYARVNYPFANQKLEDANKPVDLSGYDTFFLLGYPLSKADWGFDPYQDDQWEKNKGNTVSLWVNGESGWYGNAQSIPHDKATNVGDQLSTNVGYQTFPEKPGIVDSFISASRAGKDFYSNPNHRGGNKLIDFGLEYVPRHYAPFGGSSGSSMRNQRNELVAVFHVGNTNAMAGLAAAFRSEGFNYHGLYGSYNLPQYDLIYGGGEHQKKSFRQSLEALYGTSYKTKLFSDITKIPSEFKFTSSDPVVTKPQS